jgi:predicted ATPase/DNA-binding XRE family transcriptional regulator
MAALAPLLRRLREHAGLTQEELADRAGLSARTVSDIERGLRSRLYDDTTERLAVALALDEEGRVLFRDAARGRPAARQISDLPQPLTALVGREEELAVLCRLLLPTGRRLVTVTGVGGVGKTRVALAAGERLVAAYEGMVRFAEIAANQEPSRVPGLISTSFGAASDVSPEQLRSYLTDRPALVILDGFEHALDAAAAVRSLLTSIPTLHLVVTSRVRVPIDGAYQLTLQPLGVPEPTSTSWTTTGAAALFLARAADVQADLSDDPELVVDVCQRVSGLPLALELAAARLRHLSLGSLAERLRQDLDELAEPAQDVQRSLAETVASTLSSLSPTHRSVLCACALFAAGWRQDVLQQVCGEEVDVLDSMRELVDHGLVSLDRSLDAGDPIPRWRMLDVVRHYVSRSSDLGPQRRAAYLQSMLALVSRTRQDMGHEHTWFRVLAREEPNVLTALRWAQEVQDAETLLRLAGGMWQYWQAAGALAEGRRWLSTGLRMVPPASEETRMTALWGSGWLAYQQGDYSGAAAAGRELDQLASGAGGQAARRNALTVLGMVAIADERGAEAVERLSEALAVARDLGHPWILATSLLNLGLAHLSAGHGEEARDAVGQALRRYAEIGDDRFHARCLAYLGLISLLEDDLPRSRTLLVQSLVVFHAVGEPAGMAEGLLGLAAVYAAAGEPSRAATLTGAGERLRESIAGRALPLDRRTTERHLEAARTSLGRDLWDRGMSRGRDLSPDEAVALGTDTTW